MNERICTIDRDELAVRLMERAIGLRRPATEKRENAAILADAAKVFPSDIPGGFPFIDLAEIAIDYFFERIATGQSVQ
jgi:hypothetical protein